MVHEYSQLSFRKVRLPAIGFLSRRQLLERTGRPESHVERRSQCPNLLSILPPVDYSYASLLAASLPLNHSRSVAPFGHLGCSGAKLIEGFFQRQEDSKSDDKHAPFMNAQLGKAFENSWVTESFLNPSLERISPDLVSVTFGANDRNWVDVLEYCAVSSFVRHVTDPVKFLGYSVLTGFAEALADEVFERAARPLGFSYKRGMWKKATCTSDKPGLVVNWFINQVSDETMIQHCQRSTSQYCI